MTKLSSPKPSNTPTIILALLAFTLFIVLLLLLDNQAPITNPPPDDLFKGVIFWGY